MKIFNIKISGLSIFLIIVLLSSAFHTYTSKMFYDIENERCNLRIYNHTYQCNYTKTNYGSFELIK